MIIKTFSKAEAISLKNQFYTDSIIEKIHKYLCYKNPLDYKEKIMNIIDKYKLVHINNLMIYRDIGLLNYGKNDKRKGIYNKIAFRGLTFSNKYALKNSLNKLGFFHNDSNMYCSVARILQIPLMPINSERRIHTSKFYKNDFKKYIISYDLFLDFDFDNDSVSFSTFIKSIKKIVKYFYFENIDFEFVFSGGRGFKILIYNDYSYKNRIKLMLNLYDKLLSKNLLNDINIDWANMSVLSKLMKVNNTVALIPIGDIKGSDKYILNVVRPIHFNNYDTILNSCIDTNSFNIFNINNSNIDQQKNTLLAYQNNNFSLKYPDTSKFSDFVKRNKLLK